MRDNRFFGWLLIAETKDAVHFYAKATGNVSSIKHDQRFVTREPLDTWPPILPWLAKFAARCREEEARAAPNDDDAMRDALALLSRYAALLSEEDACAAHAEST